MTVVFHESCVSVSEGAVACENARVCKLKQRVLPQKETRERIERPTGRLAGEEMMKTSICSNVSFYNQFLMCA